MKNRTARVERKTRETDISISLNLDGSGKADLKTGIGFFDHMLDCFARHGLFDLTVHCNGDLYVDSHHSIEDVGIALGTAIQQALGDKCGIKRYGHAILPMDDSLVMCAIDLSGRPYLSFDIDFKTDKIGDMDSEMIREFFYAVSYSSAMNLHIRKLAGENSHHLAEISFKAFAKALDTASSPEMRIKDVWSTKGVL